METTDQAAGADGARAPTPAAAPADNESSSRGRREYPVAGAGLGLRRDFLSRAMESPPEVDFMEVAPENWIGVGGHLARKLRFFTER